MRNSFLVKVKSNHVCAVKGVSGMDRDMCSLTFGKKNIFLVVMGDENPTFG